MEPHEVAELLLAQATALTENEQNLIARITALSTLLDEGDDGTNRWGLKRESELEELEELMYALARFGLEPCALTRELVDAHVVACVHDA